MTDAAACFDGAHGTQIAAMRSMSASGSFHDSPAALYFARMPVPRLIPIAYEPGYRTDKIGHYDQGLFAALAWDHHAYVHLFDHDGAYQRSTIMRVADRAALEETVESLIAPLPGKVFGDIAVELFQIRHDNIVFGLIDESGDRAGDGRHIDWVELYPDRLGFHEPWDGLYDT